MSRPWIKPGIYLVSVLTLVITFQVFYQDNAEFFGSLAAAILSAGLMFVSLIMLSWLAQVFMK